jgi:nucleotide-binding universal stress UspA family protein
MKRRILVATDGSTAADRAVDYAAGLAKREGADLLIANVVGGYGFPQKAMIKLTQSEQVWLKDLLESLSAETLTKARERARAAGADQIQLESRAGDVAQSVIDIAKEKAADVIVLGKRGAGLAERLLLGSVSHKLVNLATLPVIVVP